MGGMDLIAQIAASGTVAFFGGPPPAPLPDGPFWERWLLEEPLWTAVALAVGGVVVFMILNRAGQARQGLIAAGAGLVLAAGVFVLASLVTTDREQLRNATGALVTAVAKADAAAAGELLAPEVRLRPPAVVGRASMGRDQILAFVGNEMRGTYRIENYRVLQTQAALGGPTAGVTQTYVRVSPEQTRAPTFSWWRLAWRKGSDGRWLVTDIEPISADAR
jgi:hypothetical protein